MTFYRVTDGQIIYTDVDPDIVVNSFDAFLDIDNNGSSDFEIIREELGYFNTSNIICYSPILFEGHCIDASNSFIGNEIEGLKDIVYALDTGYLINSQADLTKDAWQYITVKFRELSCISYEPIEPWNYPNIGSWVNHDEAFIGVKFRGDNFDCFHYGWIRCEVSDSLDQMTIMDYAYNSDCGEGLFAGTLTSGSNEIDSPLNNVSIVYEGNNPYVIINENLLGVTCNIFNVSGQIIKSFILEKTKTQINNNLLATGIYFLNIQSEKSLNLPFLFKI